MLSVSSLFLTFSLGVVGLALSADDGFDWGTDEEDGEYESPFADEADEAFELDEPDENPFADTADEPEEEVDDTPPTGDEFDEGTDDSGDGEEHPFASDDRESSSSAEAGHESPSEADDPTLATMADARALCDEAMGLLHAGNAARAFDRLSAHWAFSQDEMTQLQREVERTRAVVADRYGDALDYQLLRDDTTGDVLARFVYLERFELHGLRWRFTFYEGASGWTLNDVFFDDEIEALLE